MRRLLPFLIPFVSVLAAGLVVWAVGHSSLFDPACRSYDEIALDELDLTDGCVEVEGMAHYTAVVRQETEGTILRPPARFWLFGLFRPFDTDGRAIRVLVRSPHPPEDLVSYELMRVRGRVVRVTPDKVPYQTESQLEDYYFADDVILLEVHEQVQRE